MMCEWNTVSTADGTRIYYKERGSDSRSYSAKTGHSEVCLRRPDALNCFARYRATAPDRRGHGRSSQPWSANDHRYVR